jgi:hypothetical protein
MEISGRTARSPGAIHRRSRRRVARRQHRHRDQEHAVLLSAEKPFTQDIALGTTFSYTFTDAEHNRDINEHYLFDASSIKQIPFILSNAAAKHRVVATGSYRGPVGAHMLAGKLTWSRPFRAT